MFRRVYLTYFGLSQQVTRKAVQPLPRNPQIIPFYQARIGHWWSKMEKKSRPQSDSETGPGPGPGPGPRHAGSGSGTGSGPTTGPRSPEKAATGTGTGVSTGHAGTGRKHMTRGAASQNEREKFLQMSLEDKRHLYKCGERYTTLDKVHSWPQYYHHRGDKLRHRTKHAKSRKSKVSYPVDKSLSGKVSLWRGDITTLEIDVIVNAANNSLMGGGGVDGAIHSAAGGSLLRAECATLGGCATGDAKITSGYKLPAKYIAHTVGPIGEYPAQLHSCYAKCLSLMHDNKLRTIAFPCISTGIYGYPNDTACSVALKTCREWLEKDGHADTVDRIIFCLFLPVDVSLYEEFMQVYFPMEEPPDSDKTTDDEKTKPETKPSDKTTDDEKTKPETKPSDEGKEKSTDKQSGHKDEKPIAESAAPAAEAAGSETSTDAPPADTAKTDGITEPPTEEATEQKTTEKSVSESPSKSQSKTEATKEDEPMEKTTEKSALESPSKSQSKTEPTEEEPMDTAEKTTCDAEKASGDDDNKTEDLKRKPLHAEVDEQSKPEKEVSAL